jgi:hypothetical protein
LIEERNAQYSALRKASGQEESFQIKYHFLFESFVDLEDVATAFSIIGKAGAACGFGAIYVFTGELNPTSIRNIAFGTASMCARISGMAAPFVGGPLVSANMSDKSEQFA